LKMLKTQKKHKGIMVFKEEKEKKKKKKKRVNKQILINKQTNNQPISPWIHSPDALHF